MNNPPGLDPPLADYFWIAGIDSISYGEHLAQDSKPARRSFTEQLLEAIEAEEEVQESLHVPRNGPSSHGMPSPDSTVTIDPLSPIGDVGDAVEATSPVQANPSNNLIRNSSTSSSSTITNNNSTVSGSGNLNNDGRVRTFKGMTDDDFDNALLKFAAERDSFLDDLSFSAGTIVPHKPVMHPRAQRVVSEDLAALQKAPSLRRRISLRDLTSMRRAPSVNRSCKNQDFVTLCCLIRDGRWFGSLTISISYSICSHSQKNVELQFCHSYPTASKFLSKYASLETQVRTCTFRQIPTKAFDGGDQTTWTIPGLRPDVCIS